MKPIVIIGGSAAGMSAASQIKRQVPDAEVIVFSDEGYGSYGACGMPFFVSGEIKDYKKLIVLNPQKIIDERKINYQSNHQVLSINPKEKKVSVKSLETGHESVQPYEKLVIATGASAIIPPFENKDLAGIFTLKTLQDSILINQFIESHKPQKAVIIGAGFIGVEAAESFTKRGMDVSLIEAAPRILNIMDESFSIQVQEELVKNKVSVFINSKVKGFHGNDKVKEVFLEDGRILKADLVLLSIGVTPNSKIAKDAGIILGERNAILTDMYQMTNISDIYAAGDCSTVYHQLLKSHTYIPLALGANRQGRICGENISAELKNMPLKQFPGIIGSSMTKAFNLEIGKTGLGESEIHRMNLENIDSVTIQYFAKAGYYPERSKIWVRLYFDKLSQVIIGGQIVGQNGSVLRLDVIAAAISQKMTLQNLYDLDLGYCPPFSPVWDPLLLSARAGMKQD